MPGIQDLLADYAPKSPSRIDAGVSILGGVAGYFLDALLFHLAQIPPGTFAFLIGSGALGVKNLVQGVLDNRRKEREDQQNELKIQDRIRALTQTLETAEERALLGRLEQYERLWLTGVIPADRMETLVTALVDEYLQTISG